MRTNLKTAARMKVSARVNVRVKVRVNVNVSVRSEGLTMRYMDPSVLPTAQEKSQRLSIIHSLVWPL